MSCPTIHNDKPTTGMNGGGLSFVLTAKPHPLCKKDKVDVYYHAPLAPSSAP